MVKRIKAIAETGLVYSSADYDRERYQELLEISLKLLSHLSNESLEKLNDFFMPQLDYPTPKVDIRGLVLNEKDEILMAKESIDGKWTIPGGWADIGNTPSEVALKEIKEETGMEAKIVRLLAIYDKQQHPHPPEPHYVYKMVFLCRVIGGKLRPGFDMQDAKWFAMDKLPTLSEDRILKSQLDHLFKLAKEDIQEVHTD